MEALLDLRMEKERQGPSESRIPNNYSQVAPGFESQEEMISYSVS